MQRTCIPVRISRNESPCTQIPNFQKIARFTVVGARSVSTLREAGLCTGVDNAAQSLESGDTRVALWRRSWR